ncbi:uncharacterized protein MONBRDRAFT_21933 [Monosiga brevicollis MX1]|uniref:EF-hand domain-containing protein n=1 Tax=Monosiga brevicollis TaxID=81824 RepID=A9UP17_MONBE|nr:uncharacterized protein MONBRDRAFT_21933 [Monosiga brevicollis MX1]EDQ92341.1 predicted protein [Monosiga brevicollis MX1]|eukprot:XP_001742103.1 hypothetical protein [Monosiga brevicollis MX1]
MSGLTEEDITRFDVAFYDESIGDGVLAPEIVQEWMRNLGVSLPASAFKDLVHRFNANDINMSQLLESLARFIPTTTSDENLRIAFKAFDTDRSGSVSRQELKSMLEKLDHRPTNAEVEEILNAVDANGDGEIDYDEFVKLMS